MRSVEAKDGTSTIEIHQIKDEIGGLSISRELLMGNTMAIQGRFESMGCASSGGNIGHVNSVMDSKAVNGMLVFGEKSQVPLKEWSGNLASILDQLHPGSRQVLWEIDVSREEEWTPEVHGLLCETEPQARDLYHTLDRDMDWIMARKTS